MREVSQLRRDTMVHLRALRYGGQPSESSPKRGLPTEAASEASD